MTNTDLLTAQITKMVIDWSDTVAIHPAMTESDTLYNYPDAADFTAYTYERHYVHLNIQDAISLWGDDGIGVAALALSEHHLRTILD